ncbi:MAG: C40 family peptidase [Nocardioidaceae bacterium]
MPATILPARLTALTVAVLTAFALAVSLAAPADATSRRQKKIHNSLEIARNQKGDPYRYGADGPHRFDCSGLIRFSYGKAGIWMPRTSDRQARRARRIGKHDLRKGDLMFFHSGGDVYHVGIFGGWNGHGRRRVLHAPGSGRRVNTDLVWTGSWFAGTLRGA